MAVTGVAAPTLDCFAFARNDGRIRATRQICRADPLGPLPGVDIRRLLVRLHLLLLAHALLLHGPVVPVGASRRGTQQPVMPRVVARDPAHDRTRDAADGLRLLDASGERGAQRDCQNNPFHDFISPLEPVRCQRARTGKMSLAFAGNGPFRLSAT